jgi:hypothetical protein
LSARVITYQCFEGSFFVLEIVTGRNDDTEDLQQKNKRRRRVRIMLPHDAFQTVKGMR